jgi:hypothetical protein
VWLIWDKGCFDNDMESIAGLLLRSVHNYIRTCCLIAGGSEMKVIAIIKVWERYEKAPQTPPKHISSHLLYVNICYNIRSNRCVVYPDIVHTPLVFIFSKTTNSIICYRIFLLKKLNIYDCIIISFIIINQP